MWFMFPEGYTRISVEQQQFEVEIVDAQGRGFFRAPNHFAPKILEFKGFKVADELPDGAPPDLPKEDPKRDAAISLLTSNHEAMKAEVAAMREDMSAANARVIALSQENNELKVALAAAEKKIEDLEDELDAMAKPPAAPTPAPAKAK